MDASASFDQSRISQTTSSTCRANMTRSTDETGCKIAEEHRITSRCAGAPHREGLLQANSVSPFPRQSESSGQDETDTRQVQGASSNSLPEVSSGNGLLRTLSRSTCKADWEQAAARLLGILHCSYKFHP